MGRIKEIISNIFRKLGFGDKFPPPSGENNTGLPVNRLSDEDIGRIKRLVKSETLTASQIKEKEQLIKLKKQEIESIDDQILIIEKSTRTTFKQFIRLHNYLRQKYRWYYKWHLFKYSNQVHFAIVFCFLIGTILVSANILFFKNVVPSQASPTATIVPATMYNDATNTAAQGNSLILKPAGGTNEVQTITATNATGAATITVPSTSLGAGGTITINPGDSTSTVQTKLQALSALGGSSANNITVSDGTTSLVPTTVYTISNSNNSVVKISNADGTPSYTKITDNPMNNPEKIVLSSDGDTAYIINDPLGPTGVSPSVTKISNFTETPSYSTLSGGSMSEPSDLVLSPDNNTLYVTNPLSNSITRISNLSSTPVFTNLSGGSSLPQPTRIILSSDGSTAYTANSNSVTQITSITGTPTFNKLTNSNFPSPTSIALSPDNLTAYVTSRNPNSLTVIHNLLATPTYTTLTIPFALSVPESIVLTNDGNTAYIAGDSGFLKIANLSGSPVNTFVFLETLDATQLVLSSDGTSAVVSSTYNGGLAYRISNLSGTPILTQLSGGAISRPDSIVLSPNGLTAYVLNTDNDTITTIGNLAGTPTYSNNSKMSRPWAIVLSSDHNTAYVTNYGNNTVTKISSLNGTPVITDYSSSLFSDPHDLVLTTDGSTLYVTNRGNNTVTKITNLLGTPNFTQLSGGGMSGPYGIVLSPDNKTAYIGNSGTSSSRVTNITVIGNLDSTPTYASLSNALMGDPWNMALTSDGNTAYVANYSYSNVPGQSYITKISNLTGSSPAYSAITAWTGTGVANNITLSADNNTAYVDDTNDYLVVIGNLNSTPTYNKLGVDGLYESWKVSLSNSCNTAYATDFSQTVKRIANLTGTPTYTDLYPTIYLDDPAGIALNPGICYSNGTYRLSFQGRLANQNISQLTTSSSGWSTAITTPGVPSTYATLGTGAITLTPATGVLNHWQSASTSTTIPANTSVTMSYSVDGTNYVSDIATLPLSATLYTRATLATSNNSVTPSLDSLGITYSPIHAALNYPNGGESYLFGAGTGVVSNIPISWSITDNYGTSYIKTSYSLDSGNAWSVISSSLGTSSLTETWAPPTDTNSTHARVKVEYFDATNNLIASASSAADFTITTNHAPTISLTTPSNGANFSTGVTPTFTASVTDPDTGDNVVADWQLCSDNNCSTVLQSVSAQGVVLSSGTGTFSTQADEIDSPGTYYWRASDTDSFGATSGYTATWSIIVTGSTLPSVNHMKIVASPTTVAPGDPVTLTVSIRNSTGQHVTKYSGTVSFTSTDSKAVLPTPPPYTFTVDNNGNKGDDGSHTFSATFYTQGVQTVTVGDVNDGTLTASTNITVRAIYMKISASPPTTTLGVPVALTVSIRDSAGHHIVGYKGTVSFTSTDPSAVLPAPYTFTAADAGSHTFSGTFKSLGVQTVTVVDVNDVTLSTDLKIGVAGLYLDAKPTAVNPGDPVALTVSIRIGDSSGQHDASYTGTVAFTSSDPRAVLPTSHTFTTGDGGSYTFSGAFYTQGVQTVTARDETLSASVYITVNVLLLPPPQVRQLFLVAYPTTTTPGTAVALTVSIRNGAETLDAGYAGTVTITSSDTSAVLPAPYTFTAADAGSHTFSGTFKSLGVQQVTADDGTLNDNAYVTVGLTPPPPPPTPPSNISPTNPVVPVVLSISFIPGLITLVTTNVAQGIPVLTTDWWAFLAYIPRRKRKHWGVVLNHDSKLPIPGVFVELLDSNEKVVARELTDKSGQFGFLPKTISYYRIRINNPLYHFFESKPISVTDLNNQMIEDDIMLTPLPKTMNKSLKHRSAIITFLHSLSYLHFPALIVGTLYSAYLLFIQNAFSAWNIVVFILYIVFWLIDIYSFFSVIKPYGTVRDATTNNPLPASVVQLVGLNSKGKPEIVRSTITDARGRYVFAVGRSNYDIIAAKERFVAKEVKLNTDNINVNFSLEPNRGT